MNFDRIYIAFLILQRLFYLREIISFRYFVTISLTILNIQIHSSLHCEANINCEEKTNFILVRKYINLSGYLFLLNTRGGFVNFREKNSSKYNSYYFPK